MSPELEKALQFIDACAANAPLTRAEHMRFSQSFAKVRMALARGVEAERELDELKLEQKKKAEGDSKSEESTEEVVTESIETENPK